MKPFLILQLRPETEAAEAELAAIRRATSLNENECRRVRLDREALPEDLRLEDYSGTIVGGGPGCVSDPAEEKSTVDATCEAAVLSIMDQITERDLPFLGCCYGIGILAHHLGAPVSKAQFGEDVGPSLCQLTEAGRSDPLLDGLPDQFHTLVGHKEAVQELPPDCVHLVASDPCPFQMIRHGSNVYATQFHPEADAEEFATRVRIYKDRGYFEPADAERIVRECRAADVSVPPVILRRFADRYRKT